MKTSLSILPLALLMAASMTACDKNANSSSSFKPPSDATKQSDGSYRYADGSIHNADGTLRTAAPSRDTTTNRDTSKDKPTKPDATDQGNNQADLDVTQAIRKAVQAREGVSAGTKSVLVIVTASGTVTLKGEVPSEAEKNTIAEIAMSNAAGRTVDNQLVVKPAH